ncbi:MAG: LptE family protein [bacterium]|nr:LptE family protein [bacterium]
MTRFRPLPCIPVALTLCLLFALLTLTACGYRMGAAPETPTTFGTLAVPIFVNLSPEPNIQAVITGALIREFHQAGVLIVGLDQADKILEGRVLGYTNRSLARTAASTVSEYRLLVMVDLVVKDRAGKILFRNPSAQLREEYFASAVLEENEIAEAEALKSGAVDFAQDQVRHILDGISAGLGNERL